MTFYKVHTIPDDGLQGSPSNLSVFGTQYCFEVLDLKRELHVHLEFMHDASSGQSELLSQESPTCLAV